MANQKVKYRAAIAGALRAELGDTHQAVKTIMRWARVNERTVKNWLAARSGPSGENLIDLIHHSDAVFDVLLQLSGRERIVVARKLNDARGILAKTLQEMDRLMGDGGPSR